MAQARRMPSENQDLGAGMQAGSNRLRSRAAAFTLKRIQNQGQLGCKSGAAVFVTFLTSLSAQRIPERKPCLHDLSKGQMPLLVSSVVFYPEHLCNNTLCFWCCIHSCLGDNLSFFQAISCGPRGQDRDVSGCSWTPPEQDRDVSGCSCTPPSLPLPCSEGSVNIYQ